MDIIYNASFYTSGTVTVTGNSGVIATPNLPTASPRLYPDVMVPLWFFAAGSGMATDELNDVKIDWYADAAGLYTFGTSTFVQMTAADPVPPPLMWPADVIAWDIAYDSATGNQPAGPFIPAPPYCKITHTLAGTTKSMSYAINMAYLIL